MSNLADALFAELDALAADLPKPIREGDLTRAMIEERHDVSRDIARRLMRDMLSTGKYIKVTVIDENGRRCDALRLAPE